MYAKRVKGYQAIGYMLQDDADNKEGQGKEAGWDEEEGNEKVAEF
jgi:hypothetical protein